MEVIEMNVRENIRESCLLTDRYDLSFLYESAIDKNRSFSTHELEIIHTVNGMLRHADKIIVYLGGKAGRLGECVVGTALLEGTLQALCCLEKTDIALDIVVDEGAQALFDERHYQEKYGSEITFIPAPPGAVVPLEKYAGAGQNILVLDFHGAHDGNPYVQIEEIAVAQNLSKVTTLGNLFRVGLRNYAQRGPERRYADFIEELFALPPGAIDGRQAQPTLLLTDESKAYYRLLAAKFAIEPGALLIMCFFQSVVPAKCYELWDEVMQLLCAYLASHFPQQRINFLVACGPDDGLPEGYKMADMAEWLQEFTGVNNNARVLIHSTASLQELAVLTQEAILVLSDDTGPGHIAGALGIPTITPYLPGTIYSRQVWSSTLRHRGVTLEPNPYSYKQLEAAVLWGSTDIINSIPPVDIYAQVLKSLPAELQVEVVGIGTYIDIAK